MDDNRTAGHFCLRACCGGCSVCWVAGIAMRIRPEAYAQRYELARTHPQLLTEVPGLAALKNNLELRGYFFGARCYAPIIFP